MFFYLILFVFNLQASDDLRLPQSFFLGLASSAPQSEDQLNDSWMKMAEENKIPGFNQAINPQDKLKFWTDPDTELDWVEKSGAEVYRLSIDWNRVMPSKDTFDLNAIEHYQKILEKLKAKSIRIMVTLFHFSLPAWAEKQGGWLHPETRYAFVNFAKTIFAKFNPLVDYWITFNEPQVFTMMAYQQGIWPPFEKRSLLAHLDLGFLYRGPVIKALHFMSEAHIEFYEWSHQQNPRVKVGIAQHMGYHTGKTLVNKLISTFTGYYMNWDFPDRIESKMDFFGINYYGAEWFNGLKLVIEPDEEYSEAGRAIYPQGLYFLLQDIHENYPSLPIIITENGVADSTDLIRPSYLLEHLAAIAQAIEDGIPVHGYIWWTLSDNFEWSDGYCPKFGLLEVDRENNLKRIPRPSFDLYQEIAKDKLITRADRKKAWTKLKNAFYKSRPFCRDQDGVSTLFPAGKRAFVKKDWRFSY